MNCLIIALLTIVLYAVFVGITVLLVAIALGTLCWRAQERRYWIEAFLSTPVDEEEA